MTSYEIIFKEVTIEQSKSKFGGQPDWLTRPEWPISNETGKPMRFICQINLSEIGFDNFDAKYAYLFMTDEKEYVDGTWEPDGGENAIILQPGENKIRTEKIVDGPSLYKMIESPSSSQLVPKDFKSSIELKKTIEKESTDNLDIINKLNGAPVFLQDEEYPSDEKWNLLIQLDSANVPFYVNFGDAGVGYGFISEDGEKAKFLWQCV